MRIDWKKLKPLIAEETKAIRELKKMLRQPGYERSSADDRQLTGLKHSATIHHSIAAEARDRLHITKRWYNKDHCCYPRTRVHQQELIRDELSKFILPEELE